MAVRCAKCRIDSFSRALQLTLSQRATTSPSGRTTGASHAGQADGISNGRRSGPSSATRTTFGMTSPLRTTTTRSPICRPRRSISCALCSVACDTVTPPTCTGSRMARGVTAPVRPTCTSMSRTLVSACCAAGLQAIAQRGALAVAPNCRCSATASTLKTRPSIS